MSLLIGNMKSAVAFYPVGKKAGQVSKRSGGKLVSLLLLLLLLHRNKIIRQDQHRFPHEGIKKKKRNSTMVVCVYGTVEGTHNKNKYFWTFSNTLLIKYLRISGKLAY